MATSIPVDVVRDMEGRVKWLLDTAKDLRQEAQLSEQKSIWLERGV